MKGHPSKSAGQHRLYFRGLQNNEKKAQSRVNREGGGPGRGEERGKYDQQTLYGIIKELILKKQEKKIRCHCDKPSNGGED